MISLLDRIESINAIKPTMISKFHSELFKYKIYSTMGWQYI